MAPWCAVEAEPGCDCKQYDDKQTVECGGAAALKAIFGKCFDNTGSPSPGIQLLCGGGNGSFRRGRRRLSVRVTA